MSEFVSFKSFSKFLLESEDRSSNLIDFFRNLTRNYNYKPTFNSSNSDLLQFSVKEEHRDWETIRYLAEVEKVKSVPCKYKLNFNLDEKNFVLELIFKLFFKGQKSKDAPNTDYTSEDDQELFIILENIELEKILVKTSDYRYDETNISKSLSREVFAFMEKMLVGDYDSLSSKIYSLQQK